MAKLSIGFEGGTGRLEIEGQSNDVRTFVSSYEKFLGGDAQIPRRFVFRREGTSLAETTTVVIDMTRVIWISVDDARATKEAGRTVILAKQAARISAGDNRRK